jgi:tetratricopeptide (TPR) repeat protein
MICPRKKVNGLKRVCRATPLFSAALLTPVVSVILAVCAPFASLGASPEQINDEIAKTDSQIVKTPGDARLYAYRANLEHFAGNDQKALNDLDKAIELDPNDVLSLGQRSSLYARMRNWPLALGDCSTAIRLKPGSDVLYSNRGKVYRQTNQFPEAFADFMKALTMKGTNAIYWFDAGECLFRMKQYKQSAQYCTECINRDKTVAAAYYIRGLDFARMGNVKAGNVDHQMARSLGYKGFNPADFVQR